MKYMGSKNRHAREMLPIILKNRYKGQCYVEPFVGGANMIDKVDGWRIGGEVSPWLICLLKELQNGWIPPEMITESEYKHIKENKDMYEPHLVGYVGFQLSYGSRWFYSYSRDSKGKRNYAAESYRNVTKQAPNLKGIEFVETCYKDLVIPDNSLIYCDPPYEGTKKYNANDKVFNHADFWQWCREKIKQGHDVFVSEYNAPDDFVCIWEKKVSGNLTVNAAVKKRTERLFQHHSQNANQFTKMDLTIKEG